MHSFRLLTHLLFPLRVLFRGWQNISGVNFRTPTGVNQIWQKTGKNRQIRLDLLGLVHKPTLNKYRLLGFKIESCSLITSIMLNRNQFGAFKAHYLT